MPRIATAVVLTATVLCQIAWPAESEAQSGTVEERLRRLEKIIHDQQKKLRHQRHTISRQERRLKHVEARERLLARAQALDAGTALWPDEPGFVPVSLR